MKILNFFITIVDFFTGTFLGHTFFYGKNSERREAEEDYSKCAQVVDVLKFGGFGLIEQVQMSNFFWKHNKYTHPNFVLEHDYITLYGITPTHAYFCISDPSVDITNSDNFPFYILVSFFGLSHYCTLNNPIIYFTVLGTKAERKAIGHHTSKPFPPLGCRSR